MEKGIRTIIVDDEVIARDVLRNYLSKYCPEINIIDEAINSKDAIEKIKSLTPELVFLDVEMPYGNAFDVLDACQSLNFQTIFLTAFADYAVKAFNYTAAHYILKPLNIEELITAVNKIKTNITNQISINQNRVLLENLYEKNSNKKQLVLPTMEGYDLVKIETIVRLQGNGNFTDIYFNDGSKRMVCRFLKFFEEILPTQFLRVHKSHIVNIDFIKSYNKAGGGYLVLLDNTEVEVSSGYKDVLMKNILN